MKFRNLFLSTIVVVVMASSAVCAVPSEKKDNSPYKQKIGEAKESFDPIERLEKKKSIIQKKIDQGEISKEEGKNKINFIEERINEIKAFNKLSLTEKKSKLLGGFGEFLDERVKNKEMTRAEADKLLGDYKKDIESWDGTDHPPFPGRIFTKGGCCPKKDVKEKEKK